MTKPVSTSKKLRKQHTLEFRNEALKLAERIGVTTAARELSLYESQLYAWRSKLKNAHSSSEREQEMAVEIARSGWYACRLSKARVSSVASSVMRRSVRPSQKQNSVMVRLVGVQHQNHCCLQLPTAYLQDFRHHKHHRIGEQHDPSSDN